METITKKPISCYIGSSFWTNIGNIYDNSLTTYATSENTTSERHSFFAFDFSDIPESAIITGFSFSIKYNVYGRVRVRIISDATSSSSYVDINGNREIVVNADSANTNTTFTSDDLPTVVTALNEDIGILRDNRLYFKLQIKKRYSNSIFTTYPAYVYNIAINVTYELPTPEFTSVSLTPNPVVAGEYLTLKVTVK